MADNTKRGWRKPQPVGLWLSLFCASALSCFAARPAFCQAIPDVHVITQQTPVLLAQVPSPGVLPTDITKGNLVQDQATAYPGLKLRISQILPARMWLQSSVEVNQRLDTNVFLTYKKPQPDYVFRVAPNLTVGYNIFNRTSVYAQYFMIKDCYTVHHRPLTEPVTQSIAMGIRHYIQGNAFNTRASTYLDVQARELFQSKGLRQADLNPSINTNYTVNQHLGLFASALLQMRSGQLFGGPQREMDPFYTFGFYVRKSPYIFTVTDTFVTNFREPHFTYAIPAHGNCNMIADFELARQMGGHPGLQLFVRAEPVFNWRSANAVGLSGFDFRLYGGLRVSLYKQSYLETMNQIKKQLQQQDGDDPNAAAKGKGKKGKNKKGSGDAKDGNKKDDKTTPAPGTTEPGNTSSAPAEVAPSSAFNNSDLMGPAFGLAVARALGAMAAPAVGAVHATTLHTDTSSGGTVVPAVSSKNSPMARKLDAQTQADAQKTTLEPQA